MKFVDMERAFKSPISSATIAFVNRVGRSPTTHKHVPLTLMNVLKRDRIVIQWFSVSIHLAHLPVDLVLQVILEMVIVAVISMSVR